MITPERFVHYKTGIDVIDNDHYAILTAAGNVTRLLRSRDVPEANARLIELKMTLIDHMRKEENLMRGINYKWIDVHIRAHIKITQDLLLVQISDHMEPYKIESICFRLEDLFLNHIDYADLQYVADIINNPDAVKYYV